MNIININSVKIFSGFGVFCSFIRNLKFILGELFRNEQ